MSDTASNSLGAARSAYLRSAMHQPVQWMEWGTAAFARAQAENKPVLLDIGAVWCHWCHVMDRESYENAETARIINEHFVAVKVDRDERPDVDARYQAAVAAISGQGGWPLTAFLTPSGKPYFGGTYFPPVDGHGRPSLRRVLMTMAEAFEQRRDEVDESAGSIMAAIERNEMFDGSAEGPGEALVDAMVAAILAQFDSRFGGFGSQPKFPNAGALDLLLDAVGRERQPAAQQAAAAVLLTLEKMSKGGIYDHLAGGFHRYSVDERWVVPHFEKMSYDNSELLKSYAHAYSTFGEPDCARVARETMRWIDEWMSDREQGGFYASQDADESVELESVELESVKGDGDYFTWTQSEAQAVLTADEMKVAAPWFHIGELGDMRHNPEKNVLHVEESLARVAQAAGRSVEQAVTLLNAAKAKLYAARKLRPTPFVDKTVYTGWNGMMISAYLTAGRALGERDAVAFALRTLDRVLSVAWDADSGSLSHVVAYGDGAAGNLPGGLDDYVLLGQAALDAWEACGQMRYFEAALALAEAAIVRFYDTEQGGFFDAMVDDHALGALTARRKAVQDSPTPAGNSVAAALLLRLAEATDRAEFRSMATRTLECFAGVVEHLGLYAATYGLALQRKVQQPVQIVIVGEGPAADALERAALKGFAIRKSVLRIASVAVAMPAALEQTLRHLPVSAAPFAVVCSGSTCQPPVHTVEALRELL